MGKLPNVEVYYDFDNKVAKILINGVDYVDKLPIITAGLDLECGKNPRVRLEFEAENVKIIGKARKEVKNNA
ncbi:hypothetical protein [Clostridium luticellarii]|uniref:Uncharacterized protein n=1 Tax=Clostridium luticellarii TaxID=1691940 RepID=A0A2T0BQ08_9CLOT|nr:hypothetical protein [Clostridium luticellarii]PRR85966.1 hypothetical protein CLLU_09940 [Clostridium luticellarii]